MKNTLIGIQKQKACSGPFGTLVSLGNNLDAANSCQFDTDLDDLVNTNPKLGALVASGGFGKTHSLLAASPAIDAAVALPDMVFPDVTFDQRGISRPFGLKPDIGAVEFFVLVPCDGDVCQPPED